MKRSLFVALSVLAISGLCFAADLPAKFPEIKVTKPYQMSISSVSINTDKTIGQHGSTLKQSGSSSLHLTIGVVTMPDGKGKRVTGIGRNAIVTKAVDQNDKSLFDSKYEENRKMFARNGMHDDIDRFAMDFPKSFFVRLLSLEDSQKIKILKGKLPLEVLEDEIEVAKVADLAKVKPGTIIGSKKFGLEFQEAKVVGDRLKIYAIIKAPIQEEAFRFETAQIEITDAAGRVLLNAGHSKSGADMETSFVVDMRSSARVNGETITNPIPQGPFKLVLKKWKKKIIDVEFEVKDVPLPQ